MSNEINQLVRAFQNFITTECKAEFSAGDVVKGYLESAFGIDDTSADDEVPQTLLVHIFNQLQDAENQLQDAEHAEQEVVAEAEAEQEEEEEEAEAEQEIHEAQAQAEHAQQESAEQRALKRNKIIVFSFMDFLKQGCVSAGRSLKFAFNISDDEVAPENLPNLLDLLKSWRAGHFSFPGNSKEELLIANLSRAVDFVSTIKIDHERASKETAWINAVEELTKATDALICAAQGLAGLDEGSTSNQPGQ